MPDDRSAFDRNDPETARAVADQLLELVRHRWPDWNGVDHPTFVEEEITYKRGAAETLRDLLSEDALRDLLETGQTEEIVDRVKKGAQQSKLLHTKVPAAGDLALLHAEGLDRDWFADALIDFLYGAGDAPERLDRFAAQVSERSLPNRWALPTSLLFLLFPESEYFVKPEATKWLLKQVSARAIYDPTPSGKTYAFIRDLVQKIRAALVPYGVQDMIDAQSVLWVAHQQSKEVTRETLKKAKEPGPQVFDQFVSKAPVIGETPPTGSPIQPTYSLAACAAALNIDRDRVARWARAVKRKRQAIFYGPPGTGKTYVAEHLARHLVGGGDGFHELVQFHPSYAYEDFIQGLRPEARDDGGLDYPVRPGRFLDFCERARDRDGTCVLVVDEINRANLSRVFGELMYLLENRTQAIPLAAGGEPFSIPDNVRLIGTMNTADRSIALVDHALRRRFAFLALAPDYETLERFHEKTDFPVTPLVEVLRRINEAIGDPHYEVGIAYFLSENLTEDLEDIWEMEIVPYLEEYFSDRRDEVESFRWRAVRENLLP